MKLPIFKRSPTNLKENFIMGCPSKTNPKPFSGKRYELWHIILFFAKQFLGKDG